MNDTLKPRLVHCLKKLRLPSFSSNFSQHAALAANEGWPYDRYLLELSELELVQRENRKIAKLLINSKLPREKTIASFDRARLPVPLNRRLEMLLESDFLDRRENVLVFGNPGSGKTHLLAALGHALIQKTRSVYFVPCSLLVQKLLRAKEGLWLEKELKRLDKFDALIIDDIGYVQQSREEMEVLFTLLAHRYEHRSVLLTSNLIFSQWEKIFKDPMTTAAAIDRLVHHSIILELNLSSYRAAAAQKNKSKEGAASK